MVSDMPVTAPDMAEERYLKGELPLRKMREYMEQVRNSKVKTSEQLKTLSNYSTALYSLRGKRTLSWKILHPIRNRAEKRDMEAMHNFVKEQFEKKPPVDCKDINEFKKEQRGKYLLAMKDASASPVPALKKRLDQMCSDAKDRANARQETFKENIKVEAAVEGAPKVEMVKHEAPIKTNQITME
jgi:hypothetical protein